MYVRRDSSSAHWNGINLGLICPMESVPEIVCFIPLLLMPSTLGVVMVVKKIAICFVKNRKYTVIYLFIHETLRSC